MKTIPGSRTASTEAPRLRFRQAFESHFDAVNRYCLRRIPVDDVNDVVAEVFVENQLLYHYTLQPGLSTTIVYTNDGIWACNASSEVLSLIDVPQTESTNS